MNNSSQKAIINNLELIEKVKIHPCLFNDSLTDFKNTNVKTKMWNYVVYQLKSDGK